MPELPEVEVLVRHLRPLLCDRRITEVRVFRARVLRPTPSSQFIRKLRGTTFQRLQRRGKYLWFGMRSAEGSSEWPLLGHLGMTGRMYLLPSRSPLPKHAAVVLGLGSRKFVFEDTRYFGRLTLDTRPLAALGPDPLEDSFPFEAFKAALKHSKQPIKVKLLDQSLIAGIGNIYASEALFRAQISPRIAARRLSAQQVHRLLLAIRGTLKEAIEFGSTVPLSFSPDGCGDGLFYFGGAPDAPDGYEERLRVYDRAGEACPNCARLIRRIVQAARSTFYCPQCQK